MPKLTIGRVAAAAGVNVETVRYYQRRGLLEEPIKPAGGYRDYPAEVEALLIQGGKFVHTILELRPSLDSVAG